MVVVKHQSKSFHGKISLVSTLLGLLKVPHNKRILVWMSIFIIEHLCRYIVIAKVYI